MNTSTNIPAHIPDSLVFEFDYLKETDDVSCPFHVYTGLSERGAPDFFYTPSYGGHWVAGNFELIREIYRDHERFTTLPTMSIPPVEGMRLMAPLQIEPPDHQKYRRVLSPLFTPAAALRMDVEIRRPVVQLIDAFADNGKCDFVRDFARYLPGQVFLSLMDLPPERREEFIGWADDVLSGDEEVQVRAAQNITQVITDFVDHKTAVPGEDIISTMVEARSEEGERLFNRDEMINTGCFLFLAGLDTVLNTLSFSWRFLAENPDQVKKLVEYPDTIPDGVEELLRLFSVVNGSRRVREDCEFNGVSLKKGEAILTPISAANLDESVFENPYEFEPGREANIHLSFGAGIHRCLGSNLARIEIKISLEEWLKRIPEFSIAGGEKIKAVAGITMGLKSLPLVW